MGDSTLRENQYLGTLCYRGHDHNGTGKSIRYKNKGRESGGACVACNIRYHRKADKGRVRDKARLGVGNKVKAFCPMCEKFHNVTIEGGWVGNGTPRKYHPACRNKKDKFMSGAVNYGYTL